MKALDNTNQNPTPISVLFATVGGLGHYLLQIEASFWISLAKSATTAAVSAAVGWMVVEGLKKFKNRKK